MGFKSAGDASAANQTTIIGHIDGIETLLAAIQTAVEIIDNFISGARGLVTEDNSAAALTALQTIDNFISGSRGLVTEDSAAAILTALQLLDNAVVDHSTAAPAGVRPIGLEAEDYGTTPGVVQDNNATRALADPSGIQFVIGGAPHLITREIAHGTDAATNEIMTGATVSGNEVCVITRVWATADADNTDDISVRMGFGTASVPTASIAGVSGMIMSHGGIPAGGGFVVGDGSGIVAVGGLSEEPRVTTEAASTNLHTGISYYIVDQT